MLEVGGREKLPVAAAKAGSPDAWDTLFRRYQLPLYAYVFELVRAEQPALDIVQETFIAATKYIRGLRDDDRFGGWLFRIAHQKCIQHWRRSGREQVWDEESIDAMPGPESDPGELLVRQEQEAQLMEALNQLPLPQRSALLLHYLEDFPLDEIARITGVSLGTVKSRIHYGKKALRELWEERCKP